MALNVFTAAQYALIPSNISKWGFTTGTYKELPRAKNLGRIFLNQMAVSINDRGGPLLSGMKGCRYIGLVYGVWSIWLFCNNLWSLLSVSLKKNPLINRRNRRINYI